MNMINLENDGSRYKWYVLTLSALTFAFAMAMPRICMTVLFKEISDELNLNLVQIGVVWGLTHLAGLFIVFFGGLLGDRFGVKRVLIVACFLAGIAGAMRGLSESFITLSLTMFLFGFLVTIIAPNVHKVCGVWFFGRNLGLANGVVGMGMAAGFTIGAMVSATVLSPLLGSWRNVLFLYGGISILISILWMLTRSAPGQAESSTSSINGVQLRQAISRVVRIREVWILGLIFLGQVGCINGVIGYLPTYLREIGWQAVSADGTVAAFNGASMIGAIPVAILSDRLGSRKTVLFLALLMTAIGVGMLSLADGAIVWVAMILAGIVRDGFVAVIVSMLTETEGVGARYAGTATGLIFTLSQLAGFASPPIGNSLAYINPSFPFIFWAALAAIALLGFYFVKGKRHSQESWEESTRTGL